MYFYLQFSNNSKMYHLMCEKVRNVKGRIRIHSNLNVLFIHMVQDLLRTLG